MVSRWFKSQAACDFSEWESISMDMSDGYIKAVRENFERREEPIYFDRFHVSQHFNKGLDQARVRGMEWNFPPSLYMMDGSPVEVKSVPGRKK
jgi:transposase